MDSWELKQIVENEQEWRRWCVENISQIRKDQTTHAAETRVEIAQLKLKSGVWGIIGGLLPATVAFIYWAINKT